MTELAVAERFVFLSGHDSSRQQVTIKLDDLADCVSKDVAVTEAELGVPDQSLRLQQEQLTALHEASPAPSSAAMHRRSPVKPQ